MLNEEDEKGYYDGVTFFNDFEKSDDPDFKINHICFFCHNFDVDLMTYHELYEYLKICSDLYIEINPDKKDEIYDILNRIKLKYLNKEEFYE